ncbi:MAG: hypothetical protein ACRDG7_11880 [Candidatus Limnocylindria bacterium]
MGWLGRAGHLVAGLPEGPMHGHLLQFTEVEANLMAGRPRRSTQRVGGKRSAVGTPIPTWWPSASTARAGH